MKVTTEMRRALTELAHRAAEYQEDAASNELFLPLDAHARALRQEIALIRGGRGAGKTALFRALANCKNAGEARVFFATEALPDQYVWIDGFSDQPGHPAVTTLDALAKGWDDATLRAFWQWRLAEVLADQLQRRADLDAIVGPFELEHFAATPALVSSTSRYLDKLDTELGGRGEILYVAYDHLDKLGAWDSETRQRFVSTLLSFWLAMGARFRSLRPKIFLREDLLEAAESRFADASKLRARSVSLDWTVEDLFRVAVRHMAAQPALLPWLQSFDQPLVQHEHGRGQMPTRMQDADRERFATALAGRVMGTGLKKGFTHRWIPNHLKDGQERIAPRSFLVLLGKAAERAQQFPPTANVLVAPGDLAHALEATSKARVNELKEEFPIVERLEKLRDKLLFLKEGEVRRLLGERLNEQDAGSTNGQEVLERLIAIGVLVRRPAQRGEPAVIDVPDLYRHGYGIKRKGGVAVSK